MPRPLVPPSRFTLVRGSRPHPAAIGPYGVIAYTIATRTDETGIRTVLGADECRAMEGVVKEGVLLVAIGLALLVGQGRTEDPFGRWIAAAATDR